MARNNREICLSFDRCAVNFLKFEMANNMVARRSLSDNDVIRRPHNNEPLNIRDRQTMHRVIIKQGYLKKLPNAARVGSSLKKVERRWFVFGVIGRSDPYLEYYENEDSIFGSRPLNIIFLDTCYNITRNQKTTRFCNIFTLVLKDRLLSLVAPTRDAMFEWSRAIEQKLCHVGIIETSHGNNDYIRMPIVQRHSFHELAEPDNPVPREERDYLDIHASGGSFAMVPGVEHEGAESSSEVTEAFYSNVSRNRTTPAVLDDTYFRNVEGRVDENVYITAAPDSENIYMNSVRPDLDVEAVISNIESLDVRSDVQFGYDFALDRNSGSAISFSAPPCLPSSTASNDSSCLPSVSNVRLTEDKNRSSEMTPASLPSYDEATSAPKPSGDESSRYCGLQPLSLPLPPICSRVIPQSPGDETFSGNDAFVNSGDDGDCLPSPPPYSSRKMLLRGANVPLKQAQLQKLVQEMKETRGVQVIIPKNLCQNTIAFTECFNRIWIAGWNQRTCPTFHSLLHVGDQLISINGVAPSSRQMAKKLFKACSGKMNATLVIKRIPCGQVYGVNRENASTDSLGLTLVNKTAEIGLVDPTGLAREKGLEEKAPAMNGTSGEGESWWITEVNNQPLNLFFKDDEAKQRLNAIGSHISFVVQPTQLIIEIKKQLKNSKGFRDFLVR